MKTRIDMGIISKYRTDLMGIAAIMILLCHSVVAKVEMPAIVQKLLIYGNLGVDIFLLLSGYGMYYSCQKISKRGTVAWLKKHLLRILVPYIIILGPYWMLLPSKQESVFEFLYYFSTLSFWFEHVGAWYVAMLIPFYLWIPIWDSLYEKAKNKEIVILIFVVCNLLAGLHSFEIGTSVIDNIIFCLRRLPAFYVGWYLAALSIKGKQIPTISIFLGLVIFALGQKFLGGVCWYWIAALSVLLILAIMCSILNDTWLEKLFNIMGSMSLELYLTNYLFMSILPHFSITNMSIDKGNYIFYSLVLILGIGTAFLFHKAIQRLLKIAQNKGQLI